MLIYEEDERQRVILIRGNWKTGKRSVFLVSATNRKHKMTKKREMGVEFLDGGETRRRVSRP